MITEQDLQEAIAECEGQRNPNANTCIKLAAFYTIKNQLYGSAPEPKPLRYSLAPNPIPQISAGAVRYHGDSDFANAISGKDPDAMWAVMDELMTALQVVNPRLYDSVMRKIAE